jgi:glycosyltransferase involved in cell wall biosynthesis
MQTLYLANALHSIGHDVMVICYFEYDQMVVDEYQASGAEVLLLKLSRGLSAVTFIRALSGSIAERKPDIVHVQYMTPGVLSIIAARYAGARRIYATVHQPFSAWHNEVWKYLLRASALMCDHFIAVSSGAELSWFGKCGEPDWSDNSSLPRHFTIHNAVDVSRVEELVSSGKAINLKEKLNLESCYVFGYIGRLSHEKGVDILIEAFGRLATTYPDITVLVVGDGEQKELLDLRFHNELWWPKVKFAGAQTWENAMRHLSAMDAVIVPSRFEGFGLSAVEAMSASKPVIASDTGGLAEIIENGLSGILFKNEDVSELANMMEVVLKDEVKSKELSCNARLSAMEFDVMNFNEKINNLYQRG